MLVSHVNNIQAMGGPSSTPGKWRWCILTGPEVILDARSRCPDGLVLSGVLTQRKPIL